MSTNINIGKLNATNLGCYCTCYGFKKVPLLCENGKCPYKCTANCGGDPDCTGCRYPLPRYDGKYDKDGVYVGTDSEPEN